MHGREVRVFAALLLGVSAVCALAAALAFGAGAAVFCGAACALLCAIALAFTRWRYRELARLSRYLMDVTLGKQPVDIRDERPGELSALKDDIYKVTTVLDSQRAALEADRTFLSDALSNIAHQLKTPLAAISLQAELWGEADIPGEMKDECARNVAAQTRRIEWLIERLLKMSRLDADAVRFDRRLVPAQDVIRRASGSLVPAMSEKGIGFTVDCPDALSCLCDAAWTAEALANLIKNASEHTPAGGAVRVAAGEDLLSFTFTVENTGEPISEADMPHLFERFYKGQNATPASAGIGLALARAIAEGQKGGLVAENTPDGVRFLLKLYK